MKKTYDYSTLCIQIKNYYPLKVLQIHRSNYNRNYIIFPNWRQSSTFGSYREKNNFFTPNLIRKWCYGVTSVFRWLEKGSSDVLQIFVFNSHWSMAAWSITKNGGSCNPNHEEYQVAYSLSKINATSSLSEQYCSLRRNGSETLRRQF